jgi:hypothetical protein
LRGGGAVGFWGLDYFTAAAGLTDSVAFFTGFLCDFLLCVLALGAVVLFGAAGGVVWAANVNDIVASASAIPRTVVFMVSFLPGGLLARSQSHLAVSRPELR